jgi:Fe-S-cluster containining protein
MPAEKAIAKTLQGEEITVREQTPIPCFRCGICCTDYHAPVTSQEIGVIASALGISRSKFISRYTVKVPTKEGYLLKHTDNGCAFLAWDAEGKARCTIYSVRPKACRDWTPSLSRPECLEGLAKLKSEGKTMLLEELFPSPEERKELDLALAKIPPQSSPARSSLNR